MTFFAISILVVNLILWGFLIIRFKKIFSTDSIVEKTRNQINNMVSEIDNITDRDIALINESTKRLKLFISDAEKKMHEFEEATNRLRDMIAQAEYIAKNAESNSFIYNEKHQVSTSVNQRFYNNGSYTKSEVKPVRKDILNKKNIDSYVKNSKQKIDPDSTFEIITEQDTLFDTNQKSILTDETKVTSDGAAYKEVPLIITKVYDEKPVPSINKKSDLNDDVQRLYNQGYSVEQIATELSCSETEVQFIIDMYN